MDFAICIGWVSLVTALQAALGFAIVRGIERLLAGEKAAAQDSSFSLSLAFLLGTIVHLWLVLLIRIVCDSLIVSTAVPLVLSAPGVPALARSLRLLPRKLGVDTLLFMGVVLFLGASLLNTVSGLTTAWVNAYGDFGWHIGMITSFVFGNNFPPTYHIYPGRTLSYPFFVNLWSAALWAPSSFAWRTLPLVFFVQWSLCWGIVGALLRGRGLGALPWMLLFGGGTIAYALDSLFVLGWFPHSTAGAHQLIENGGPWAPFITTVWVPQRAATFGVAVIAALLAQVMKLERGLAAGELSPGWARDAAVLCAITGGSLLVHTHFVIMGAFLLLPPLVAATYRHPYWRSLGEKPAERELWQRCLALCVMGGVASICALPWLIDKAGTTTIVYGWMSTPETSLRMTVGMWRRNAPVLIGLMLLLTALPRTQSRGLILLLGFFVANIVLVSVWNWDQFKFFIVIYFVTIAYFLTEIERWNAWFRWPSKAALTLILTLPAIIETQRIFLRQERYTIYNQRELDDAALIRTVTPKGSVIAGKPDHNSLVTLTGRSLFFGYVGTLSTHGIDYVERGEINADLDRIRSCAADAKREGLREELCPSWLLWTWRERGYWKRDRPGEGFEEVLPNLLYRVLPSPTNS